MELIEGQVELIGKGTADANPLSAKVTNFPTDGAKDATVQAGNQKLDSLLGKDFATSAKQDGILTALGGLATQTKLEAVRVLLDSINTKDFATQATLAAAKADLDALASKDFATSAKQDDASAKLASMVSQLGDPTTVASVIGLLRKLLDFAQPCQSWTTYDTGFVTGVSAPAANQWKTVLNNGTAATVGVGGDQEVPLGYAYVPTKLYFWASAASITGRLVEKTMLGDLNKTGLTFTPGDTAITGEIDHWSFLDFEIMTSFGASAVTQTVNYLDWDGTQRSTTFTIPANQAVGTRVRVFPDPAGLGFRKIVSTPLGTGGGRGKFWGIKEIASVTTTAANTGGCIDLTEPHPIQQGTNRYMAFEMTSTATTAVTVRFTASGCFIPGFV